MKVKEEYKGKVITINDGILGMIKIDLNTIKPMQQRRLIALGYTHLFEDEKVESHEPEFKPTSQEVIDAITEIIEAPVKKTTRKKKVQ
ncbi:hypothetical protein [Flavobacterium sp.]|jgi:hypothetical protein|uniref:hypothetical protein n=1 Tax=Flavobacterium sp. TaxID=239 RepID=UPI0037BE5F42